jgi:hypothetical protein
MQTKFDEDGLPLATNHAGWDVQGYEGVWGWNSINDSPFESKAAAHIVKDHYQKKYPDGEFRVYEALEMQ